MKEKKLSIYAIVMTALILLFGALKNVLPSVHIFSAFNVVLGPLLFIAALVCAYFLFKDAVTRPGKWIWVVIAFLAGLALYNFQEISRQIVVKAPVLQMLAPLVYTAGSVCILLSLLDEKLQKLLTIGFGALALAALLSASITFMTLVEFLVYVCLALAAQDFSPKQNKIYRTIAVVLAVIGIGKLGIVAAIGWIIFAFILVPAEKPTCRFSFAKFTAVLCVITAVFVLVAFLAGNPLTTIEYRNNKITATKEDITANEERIVTLTADIATYQTNLEEAKSSLMKEQEALAVANTELETAVAALQEANAALDKVCTWSYYSSWWCGSDCRPLHDAVTSCSDTAATRRATVNKLAENVQALEDTIEETEDAIQQAEHDIVTAEENIVSLTKQLKDLRSLLFTDWFVLLAQVVALLLTIASLVCFARCFFTGIYDKHAFMACGAMALGSLLYILVGRVFLFSSVPVGLYLLTSPHTWNIVVAALFATIFAKKEGKLAKFRVLAVIAALVVGALSATSGIGVLYAVTMICVAFVLVPAVFTEYNSIAKHIFFTFITLGLWQLIWTYHVTKNLNKVSGVETRKPGLTLLLCLILPFYYTYWLLKTGENVEAYAREKGKQCKLDILCLVFAFICPLISTVLIQNKINMIVGKPE